MPAPRNNLTSRPSPRRGMLVGAALSLLLLAVSCTRADPEPTTAELLAELEGRTLTPAEVAQREEVATLLCGLDDEVLVRLWDQLEPEQLEFQDFVFVRQCPERNALYAEATGRFTVNTTPEDTPAQQEN